MLTLYHVMKETSAAIVLIIVWIGLCLFLGRNIEADLSTPDNYEPCQDVGHPLWQDC